MDYVKIIGATEPKTGVVTTDSVTQVAHLIYIPEPNFFGEDTFQYIACDCAYNAGRTSEKTEISLLVGDVNDAPITTDMQADLACEVR